MLLIGLTVHNEWYVTRTESNIKIDEDGYLVSGAVIYRASSKEEIDEYIKEYLITPDEVVKIALAPPALEYMNNVYSNLQSSVESYLNLQVGYLSSYDVSITSALHHLLFVCKNKEQHEKSLGYFPDSMKNTLKEILKSALDMEE